jgi:hypothetical protein
MSTTYVEFSTSCSLSWKATLVPSLHLVYCSYNFPLRHSLLDAVAVRLHSLESSRQMVSWSSIAFWLLLRRQLIHDDKYPPCPRWFLISSTTSLTSFHRELVHVMNATCSPACIVFCLEVLLSFMLSMLWGLLHLSEILGIVILLTITILSWSPCWF